VEQEFFLSLEKGFNCQKCYSLVNKVEHKQLFVTFTSEKRFIKWHRTSANTNIFLFLCSFYFLLWMMWIIVFWIWIWKTPQKCVEAKNIDGKLISSFDPNFQFLSDMQYCTYKVHRQLGYCYFVYYYQKKNILGSIARSENKIFCVS
jgi:hypothetical protein